MPCSEAKNAKKVVILLLDVEIKTEMIIENKSHIDLSNMNGDQAEKVNFEPKQQPQMAENLIADLYQSDKKEDPASNSVCVIALT